MELVTIQSKYVKRNAVPLLSCLEGYWCTLW